MQQAASEFVPVAFLSGIMSFSPSRDVLVDTYSESWRDFYAWEQQDALRVIQSLAQDEESLASSSDLEEDMPPPPPSRPLKVEQDADGLDSPVFERDELDAHDSSWTQTFADDIDMTASASRPRLRCLTTPAGPRYHGCDAVVQRIWLGEEEKITHPRAIPFADDPSFDQAEYLENFAVVPKDAHANFRSYLLEFQKTIPLAQYDPNCELELVRREPTAS